MNPKLKKIWKYKKFMKGLKNSFFIKWSNCGSFQHWIKAHNQSLGYLSEFCGKTYAGVVNFCEVFYENGNAYTGSLFKGKKHGIGAYIASEYRYEGEWKEDQVSFYLETW